MTSISMIVKIKELPSRSCKDLLGPSGLIELIAGPILSEEWKNHARSKKVTFLPSEVKFNYILAKNVFLKMTFHRILFLME